MITELELREGDAVPSVAHESRRVGSFRVLGDARQDSGSCDSITREDDGFRVAGAIGTLWVHGSCVRFVRGDWSPASVKLRRAGP